MINADRIARDVIVVGGSAGGLAALLAVLKRLPPAPPVAMAVALHRRAAFESQLSAILGRAAPLPVSEPSDGDPVELGHVHVAPRDLHMTLCDGRWHLARGPKIHGMRPAIDPLFASVARQFGPRVAGILLSGGGSDGVSGLITIKALGGVSIAQDPSEAQVNSMPMHAILNDHVDAVLRTDEIAAAIPEIAVGEPHDEPPRRLLVP